MTAPATLSAPSDALAGLGPAVPEGRAALDGAIRRMAWPAVAALLLENASELIDIAMVGRLGATAVAAVGYGAQLAHLVTTLLMAVAVAAVALMTRAIGAGDPDRARVALGGALTVAAVVSTALAGACLLFPEALLHSLGAEPGVTRLATPYLRLAVGGAWIITLPLVLESALRARRDTRTPLVIAAVMAASKVTLNAALIFGLFGLPRLELVGAGLATVLSALIAAMAYLMVAFRDERRGLPTWPRRQAAPTAAHPEGYTWSAAVADAVRLSSAAVGERLAMNLALIAYFSIVSAYGASAIAAYAIGVRVLAFTWLPSIAVGTAAATLVGQALGARRPDAAAAAGWRSVRLSLQIMGAAALGCLFLRDPLARVFTHDLTVIAQLTPFLAMLAVAQPFMAVHFTLSGALRGAGDTLTPLVGATVGNWALRVPLAWGAARLGLPLAWAWGALVADHVLRCAWYLVSFRRGTWQRAL